MRFQINEIRVKNKIPCPDQFSWLQRLAIKWLKIPVTKKYNYEFILTSFIEGYLQPGMIIYLSNPHLNQCVVIGLDPNDKKSVVVSSINPFTTDQANLLRTSKEGVCIAHAAPEDNNFKRKHYDTRIHRKTN